MQKLGKVTKVWLKSNRSHFNDAYVLIKAHPIGTKEKGIICVVRFHRHSFSYDSKICLASNTFFFCAKLQKVCKVSYKAKF